MTRYKRRADDNQTEIAEALRQAGFQVVYTHRLGHGFPDLVVAKRGVTILVEVKSRRGAPLSKAEEDFWKQWQGGPLVLTWSPEHAVKRCVEEWESHNADLH